MLSGNQRLWMCFILTPGVPFTIEHSEGFTRIGQTYRAQVYTDIMDIKRNSVNNDKIK